MPTETRFIDLPGEFSQADAIVLAYPDTPDWEQVPQAVLVELIEQYAMEPSCASSAILQLSLRDLPLSQQLARWLLAQPGADQWLKAAARDVLDE